MKTLVTMLVLSAMCIAVASAQPGQGQGSHQGGNMKKHRPNMEQLFEQLDLTTEQRAALDQEKRTFQKKMVDLRADAKNARDAMRGTMESASVTREGAMKAFDTEAAAELAVRKAAVEHRLNVRDIIGPENAAKLIEMRKERREEMMERGGPGRDRGQGPGRGDENRGPPEE